MLDSQEHIKHDIFEKSKQRPALILNADYRPLSYFKNYVVPTKTVPFTRANLFLRDEFTCQYCGCKGRDLTFDHVVPKSRGGKTRWDNVVAACQACNLRKAAKTTSQAGFKLKKVPTKPSPEVLLNKGKKFPPSDMHKSWSDFLYFEKDFN